MPDPIEFELFKNAILSIADEMALTIVRTAYSGVLRDNMDFSTAVADGDGRLVQPVVIGDLPASLSRTEKAQTMDNLALMVLNAGADAGGKLEKARACEVEIIDEAELLRRLGRTA